MMSWAPPSWIEGHCHAIAAWGVVVGSRWQKCHRITPPTLAPSRQQSLRSATAHSPHENQQSIAAILAVIAPKIF
jgi:hypothetical protein